MAGRFPVSMSNPSPYRTIAVASTFSPRFVQVLSEAIRIRDRFSSELQLIYVGECTAETTAKFGGVLRQLNLPPETTIHYEQGDPADTILHALRKHNIDMIIAGALEKEVVFHPFLGNVARRLVREASCSVMLFTHPDVAPKPFRRIVFVADQSHSEHARSALQKAFRLAAAESTERLYVIRVLTTFDEARASRHSDANKDEKAKRHDDDEAALENFVLSAGPTEVPIETRYIRGNTGFAAADFVQSIEADLLAVSVPTLKGGEPSLPANIAWLTDIIPCNLWVIR
jgi:nucleotide-binding universal stress UspA family protein